MNCGFRFFFTLVPLRLIFIFLLSLSFFLGFLFLSSSSFLFSDFDRVSLGPLYTHIIFLFFLGSFDLARTDG